jgi:hypothetical protein
MGASTSMPVIDFSIVPFMQASPELLYAEQIDNYRKQCNEDKLNTISRRGHLYSAYNYPTDYLLVLRETLNVALKDLPNKLNRELQNVNIIILYPSADGGMPHTRPNDIICFPYTVNFPSLETITHELWHIHQRKYPDFWQLLLERAWQFKKWDGDLPAELEKHRRINPDTLATQNWIWQSKWVPVPVFIDASKPSLTECQIWYHNVITGRTEHGVPQEVYEYFGRRMESAAYEHPYEMAAYMLSRANNEPTTAWNRIKYLRG